MKQISEIISDFKAFENPLLIKSKDYNYNRFSLEDEKTIIIDYLKKENLSFELLNIKIILPNLAAYKEDFQKIEQISNLICSKVTYLTDNLNVIEIDRQSKKVQIRSNLPFTKTDLRIYFELIIDLPNTSISLERKESDIKMHQTKTIPFVFNEEQLERLLTDLISIEL